MVDIKVAKQFYNFILDPTIVRKHGICSYVGRSTETQQYMPKNTYKGV
jgi:hypothetical protein